jgi:HEAT repeat protein
MSMTEIETLLETLGKDAFTRLAARRELVAYGSIAVEPLIRLLQTGTLIQIASAIVALGEIEDRRAIQPLIQQLRGKHQLIRMNAATALGSFRGTEVIDALLESLHDESELVQTAAVVALAALQEPCTVKPLIALLDRTPSASVRYIVIRALGDLGDTRAISHIIPFQHDEDLHVQRDAHEALIKLGYQ